MAIKKKKNPPGTENSSKVLLDPSRTSRPAPLRFWEIDKCFKCPIIGLCLTLFEQRQLLKKAGFSTQGKGLFDIHEVLVASADGENRLSRRIDTLLNRKFRRRVNHVEELDAAAAMDYWKIAHNSGDYSGALWAIVTRSAVPADFKRELFGSVHMAMHSTAAERTTLHQKITDLHRKIAAMHRDAMDAETYQRSLRKGNKTLLKEQNRLESMLASIRRDHLKLKEALAGHESRQEDLTLKEDNKRLSGQLSKLRDRFVTKQQEVALLREKNKKIASAFDGQRKVNKRLRKEIKNIVSDMLMNRCNESCPSFDLCQRRILMVGGMTRMESLYRQVIESSGGIFDYHNGYMKNGVKGLENRLRRADLVLCPVSCNSHAACAAVKNLAKKHCKPVHMMANSSLNAVTQVISKKGGGTLQGALISGRADRL